MNPFKEDVIKLIRSLPDDCTIEDIQYHLYVRDKIEKGLQDVAEGRVVSQEEAEKRVLEWLAPYGAKQP